MQFHARFRAQFTEEQLQVILAKAASHCVNGEGEITITLIASDKVFAELYADDTNSDTLSIMDFGVGPLSADQFWTLLSSSAEFPQMQVWNAGE